MTDLILADPNNQHAYVEVERIDDNGNKQIWKYYSNKAVGSPDFTKMDNKGKPSIAPFVYVDRGDGNGLVKYEPTHPHRKWHTETAIGEIINQDNNQYGQHKIRLFSKNSPCVGMCLPAILDFSMNAELKIAFDQFYQRKDKNKPKVTIDEESAFRERINQQLNLENNKVQFYQFAGKDVY